MAKTSVKGLLGADFAGLVPAMDGFLAEHRHLGEVDDLVVVIRSRCCIPKDLQRVGYRVVAEVDGDELGGDALCERWRFTYADRSIALSYLEEDARRIRADLQPAVETWLASVRRRESLRGEVLGRRADDPKQPWTQLEDALGEERENRSRLADIVHPNREAFKAARELASERVHAEPRRTPSFA